MVHFSVVVYCKSLKLYQPTLAVLINIHFIGVPIHFSCNYSYCADSFFMAAFGLCVFKGYVRVWTLKQF